MKTLLDKPRILRQKASLTRLDKALCDIAKIGERWNDRLTIERLSLAKDYREGRIELIATLELFRIETVNGSSEICPVRIRLKICSSKREQFIADRELQFIDVEKRKRWHDQYVFIPTVKIVESADGVLPSVVGFQILNDAECLGSGPLHLSLPPFPRLGVAIPITGFYEFLPIFSSREVNVSRVTVAVGRATDNDRYVIKCGPNIMDDIADNTPNSIGIGFCGINMMSSFPGSRLAITKL